MPKSDSAAPAQSEAVHGAKLTSKIHHRALVSVGAMLTVLALSATESHAIDRKCPRGQVWSPNQGSCIKKRVARRKSPERKYQEAVGHMEGTIRRADPERVPILLAEACAAEHAQSCTLLGFLQLEGRFVAADPSKSLELYTKACGLEDPFGCLGAADVARRGLVKDKNAADAVPHLEKACTLGSGAGCHWLAESYAMALGVSLDREKAATLYTQAFGLLGVECRKSAPSCYLLGESHRLGHGTAKDATLAFKAYELGCKRGAGDACQRLAISYRDGIGTALDQTKAMTIYERACKRYDNARSCEEAARLMVSWPESARDTPRLLEQAKRACELDKRQCDILAYLHAKGTGLAKSEVDASKYYEIACEHGNAIACSNSAARSFAGTGVPKNTGKAIDLWQRSCSLKHTEACYQLGEHLRIGDGVEKNYKRAFAAQQVGCIRAYPPSCLAAGQYLEDGADGSGEPHPDQAIVYYRSGCLLSHGPSCANLAGLADAGLGMEADLAMAFGFHKQACSFNHHASCVEMGHRLYNGTGVAKNEMAAGLAYAEACERGAATPCQWADLLLGRAKADDNIKEQARGHLERACKGGNEWGCIALGRIYAFGGAMATRDGRTAFGLFDESCKRGFGESCVQLALLYKKGIGVVQDDAKAKLIFREQCDAGRYAACAWLGRQMWTDRDYDGALRIFGPACDGGVAIACNFVGFANYTGKGTRWDVRKAAGYYLKACNLEVASACANLGEMTEHGIGVEKNLERARQLFELGCTPSSAVGCGSLGRFYDKGLGGSANEARAEREYVRACDANFSTSAESCQKLAEMYRRTGKGSASDIAALLQKAYDLAKSQAPDNPYGKYVLAKFVRDGVSVVPNKRRAAQLFGAGCEGYDALSCWEGGLLNANDPSRLAVARVQLGRACAAGIADACAKAKSLSKPLPGDKPPPYKPPPPVQRKGAAGCACDVAPNGSGLAGGLVMLLVVLWTYRRRRLA